MPLPHHKLRPRLRPASAQRAGWAVLACVVVLVLGSPALWAQAPGTQAELAPATDVSQRAAPVEFGPPAPEAVQDRQVEPSQEPPLDPGDPLPASAAGPGEPTSGAGERSAEVIRAVLGLILVTGLAYLGGHPRVQRLERRLRIAHVATTGLPFVMLGMLARQPQVGVLSDRILENIAPLLPLGLGWLGLAAGFRFDARMFQELPAGTARVVAWTTLLPLALVAGMAGLMLFGAEGLRGDGHFLRDALILGCAALLSGRSGPSILRDMGSDEAAAVRMQRVIQLQDLVALVGLLLVSSFFRPAGSSGWELPGIAWLFVAIGMGGAMGMLVYAALTRFDSRSELMTILLGSVCLCAGMASYLRLSPLAVCFLTGLVLSNFPSNWRDAVRDGLNRMERTIYLMFLVIAGALWHFGDWHGWALLALFVVGRLSGKVIGARMASGPYQALDDRERKVLAAGPIGALAIAIVVNAQDLYPSPTISWIVTPVIGGAFLGEILVQLVLTRSWAGRNNALRGP